MYHLAIFMKNETCVKNLTFAWKWFGIHCKLLAIHFRTHTIHIDEFAIEAGHWLYILSILCFRLAVWDIVICNLGHYIFYSRLWNPICQFLSLNVKVFEDRKDFFDFLYGLTNQRLLVWIGETVKNSMSKSNSFIC